MLIQLIWTDPATGERKQPYFETPIALGRTFERMPTQYQGQRISRVLINDEAVSEFHALIDFQNGEVQVTDQTSETGTFVNNLSLTHSSLADGDRLQIGSVVIEVKLPPREGAAIGVSAASSFEGTTGGTTGGDCDRQVGFLFKRRCGRTNPKGCLYCRGGNLSPNEDPYREDYVYYPRFGTYRYGWGSGYYHHRDHYIYHSDTNRVDFTEADAASFEEEGDQDFEQDLGAS